MPDAENPVLQTYPVAESNLFLMTRFAKTDQLDAISRGVAQSATAFGLEFVRADDTNVPGEHLWQKVEQCMRATKFGVAVFDHIDKPEHNPNISLELGYMLALGNKCLLLREKQVPRVMADLQGFLHKQFDAEDISDTVLGAMADWLREVGVRKNEKERLIVFVSGGGTCRCAMAKAITLHLTSQVKIKSSRPFRVESRAAFDPSRSSATNAAIEVARQRLGEDYLSEHRPRRMGVGFLYEADLILATDRFVLGEIRKLFEAYPGSEADRQQVKAEIKRKSQLLTEFFGSSGDVPDPWPDNGDEASMTRYRDCFATLHSLISPNLAKLEADRHIARPLPFGTTFLSG
jgi:protein-tyrosine-phosphatase